MAAKDAAGHVIVVDGLYQNILALEIIRQGMGPDQSLFFAGVDGEDDGAAESIFAHDPRQLHYQGGTRGVITDAGGAAGDVAVTHVTAVHMAFDDDQRWIDDLAAGQDGHDIVLGGIAADTGTGIG